MVRRKGLLLGIIFLLLLLASPINPSNKKTIGVIIPGGLRDYKESCEVFIRKLRTNGYDNTRVGIYVQTPNPDPISILNSIRKFLAYNVDLMVIYGTSPLMLALKEAEDIPIIFLKVYEPYRLNLLKRPNVITGISSKLPLATLIEALKGIKPFKSLGVLYNSNERNSVVELNEIKRIAPLYDFNLIGTDIKKPGDIKAFLERVPEMRVEALYISSSALVNLYADRILSAANKYNLPVIGTLNYLAEKGALISLAPDPEEEGNLAALKIMRFLESGSFSRIPVERSKRMELIINIKSAKAIGLEVPFDVLSKATTVIK